MSPKKIRILTLQFDTEIASHEIPLFRGAIIASMGDKANLLYHNHTDETGFRYSYPLIQYKRIGRKAAIVCLQEGADVIGQFLSEAQTEFSLGNRKISLTTEQLRPSCINMQTWKDSFSYHIQRWLPLNSENYRRYQEATGLIERISLLEQLLKANILSMAKGLGLYIDNELAVHITQLSDPYLVTNKGVKLMSFNADFTCNFSLPNYIGLGKNASIGYGVVTNKE